MLEEYMLSKSLLSDGEGIRSLCYVESNNSDTPAAAAAAAAAAASSKSEDTDTETAGILYAGSQAALITRHVLSSSSGDKSNDALMMETFRGGHSHQVTALSSIPPSAASGDAAASLQGGFISGSKDQNVRVFGGNHELVRTMQGHSGAVTSLSWVELPLSSGERKWLVVSGSWDGTARLWDVQTGLCLATLPGHENTVCVQGLPPTSSGKGRLVTGSAGVAMGNTITDHKLRLWELDYVNATTVSHVMLKELMDHKGPIRGLCIDPTTNHLASCSNDGTLKVRHPDTLQCLQTLKHPGAESTEGVLILNVTSLGDGRYVTVTEDGSAIVWKADPTLKGHPQDTPPDHQILLHPDCVWCVLPLPNGDFCTACNDGVTRIFTSSPTRCAPQAELDAYHDLTSQALAKKSSAASGGGGPSAEEIAKLPQWEQHALFPPGKSEGQVQLFSKNGTTAIAAQWSAQSQTWIEVGEVTGRADNAGTVDGVQYDHVFPIEIDVRGGGVQTLHIGYNNGENPFVTAQAFIDKHELDQNYLSQIADYVRQRAGQAAPTLGMGAPASGTAGATSGMPSASSVAAPIVNQGPSFVHLPMTSAMTFATGAEKKALSKITTKIQEFSSANPSKCPLSNKDALLESLTATLAATSRYHASQITKEELDVVKGCLETWEDVQFVFPFLDLARLVVLHPDAHSMRRKGFWMDVFEIVLDKCCQTQTLASLEGVSAVAVPMLSMRLFANAFKGGGSSEAVASFLERILDLATSLALDTTNKNVRVSIATVALNASSYMNANPSKVPFAQKQALIQLVSKILTSKAYENEAVTRCLVAFGTTCLAMSEAERLQVKTMVSVKDMVQGVESRQWDKAAAVAKEIQTLLKC